MAGIDKYKSDPFAGYTPFGPEWEKEMMKLSKRELVEIFKITMEAKDREKERSVDAVIA